VIVLAIVELYVLARADGRSKKVGKARAASKALGPWSEKSREIGFDWSAAAGQSYDPEAAHLAAEYARDWSETS